MTATETICDRLRVSKETTVRKAGNYVACSRDRWVLRYWYPDDGGCEKIDYFPAEDEAYGVAALIIEYVELHGYDEERACAQAMIEYREALECAGLAPDIDPDDAARQDHRAFMEVA